MKRFLSAASVALSLFATPVFAQSCGGTYTIKGGDSLSLIADRLYKDVGKWTAIHQSNISAIGTNPNSIRIGQRLNISCIDGLPTGLDGGTVVQTAAAAPAPKVVSQSVALLAHPIRVVTEDFFSPFTDRKLKNGGMLADVVTVALDTSVGADGFDFFWINDATTHLDPLLTQNIMDMSLAWAKPDCVGNPDHKLCKRFLFSDATFEYLVLLFSKKSAPVPFAKDADVEGRILCRPEGYLTHMLDANGRNWVKDGKVTLKRGINLDACFDMLTEGDVDAVVINEFSGRAALKRLGLKDTVEVGVGQPVSITTLHVVVSKGNPNASALLNAVDTGLAAIKQDGRYQQIIDDHMGRIWANF